MIFRTTRRWVWRSIASALTAATVGGCAGPAPFTGVNGVVWQPDPAIPTPSGDWNRLGATEVLVQWMVVDGQALIPGTDFPAASATPDWDRIRAAPWANRAIVGLVGRTSEVEARANVVELAVQSRRLAATPMPLKVSGWYFPVEVDPSWSGAETLAPLLADLPRPLWISVYDRRNLGPEAFAAWLLTWLPDDVGVLFQDGVGEHVRGPEVARAYADQMTRALGSRRVAIIAEAFRPRGDGRFRSATADELRAQLAHYHGLRSYLFGVPHYLPPEVVDQLVQ